MDVTCPDCSTEYEFDETLVSATGTTVKCTTCGHLFKVFRDNPSAAPQAWLVRLDSGETLSLGSLRALQQKIAVGELSPTHLISRSGDGWKPLGDIAELKSFFAAAKTQDDAPTQVDGTNPTRKSTLTGVGRRKPIAPPPRTPAPPRASPVPPPPASSQAPQAQLPNPLPAMQEKPMAAASTIEIDKDQLVEVRAPKRARNATPTDPVRANKPVLRYDEHEHDPIPAPPSKYGFVKWILVLGVLGAVGAGVYLNWPKISQMAGLSDKPDPVAAFLETAETYQQKHSEEGYREAIREFTRATAHSEHDPRVHIGLAQAHAGIAQLAFWKSNDLDKRAGDDAARKGQAAHIAEQAAKEAGDARRNAEDAVRIDASSVEAEIALANALRLSGDLSASRKHLNRAQDMEAPGVEHHIAQALLLIEEDGAMTEAQEAAQKAVDSDPKHVLARLVLARIALAGGNVSVAHQHVDAVLADHKAHPIAIDLKDAMDRGIAPAPPVVAMEEGNSKAVELAVGTESPTTESPTTESSTTKSPASANTKVIRRKYDDDVYDPNRGSDGRPPEGREYGWYLAQGQSFQNSNKLKAISFYEAALEVRPNGAEALSGLAFVHLANGNNDRALRYFRPAMRQGKPGDAFIGAARASLRMGNKQQAIAAYQGYLDRYPNGPKAGTARGALEQLDPSEAKKPPGPVAPPTPAPVAPPAPEPKPAPTPEPAPGTPPTE